MKIGNTTLIPQNVAPADATRLLVLNKSGNVVLTVPLGRLAMPDLGVKLYSVGLGSDSHVYADTANSYKDDTTANVDLANALIWFRDNADFTCIAGDLTCWGTSEDLTKYKSIVDTNRGDMPVYAIPGNHEYWGKYYGGETLDIPATISTYTGYPVCYTITKGDDVYIFCGSAAVENEFDQAQLQWLYGVLENNRNRRCFLFTHAPLMGAQYCGDSTGIISTVDMIGRYGQQSFIALLNHYQNVIWFHGHTHTMLQMQNYSQSLDEPLPANYDNACGVHSVHIPSLSMPRDISSGSRVEMYAESQGYIMDVYQNNIVLRGIDFVAGTEIPIARYCLDTALVEIDAGTFDDPADIITT